MYIRGPLGVSENITDIEDFFEVVDLGWTDCQERCLKAEMMRRVTNKKKTMA